MKYRNKGSGKYLFKIINEDMNDQERHYAIKGFTRFVNQHLKKLAKAEDLTEEISTYWARHTFSTLAVRNGASLEFISEALNHHDLKTTQGYMAGFDDQVKKDFSNKLMDF